MEKYLIRHCAPTLAGMKTGNLFGYRFSSLFSLLEEVRQCRKVLERKGVSLFILQIQDGRALVYLCRRKLLLHDWQQPGVSSFMERYGYNTKNPELAIARLSQKLCTKTGFPHEIGLFLGYPFADVQGFIQNEGQNCKCCGCWKVYCDEQHAKRQFERFAKCTRVYCKCFLQGTPISRLTVAA